MLERLGGRAAAIRVGRDGRVTEETLTAALSKHSEARFAAIMAVNNETGAVMDIGALSAVLRRKEGAPVHLHCDLVQAVGKAPVDIEGWGLDSASISAHKIGGPRGVGLLYLKKPLLPVYTGGSQEGGIRAGTENVAGAFSMAEALENRLGAAESAAAAERFASLIGFLKDTGRASLIPDGRAEYDSRFSPYILQMRLSGIPGEALSRMLDDEGFAVSTGSACSAARLDRPVLRAMGLDAAASLEGVRISQGWTTSVEDIEALKAAIRRILDKI
jgi:cysteine desulfurase